MGTVCVFCGSSPGVRPSYRAAARALGERIASRGHRLVYGGAGIGLMGRIADAALRAGGEGDRGRCRRRSICPRSPMPG